MHVAERSLFLSRVHRKKFVIYKQFDHVTRKCDYIGTKSACEEFRIFFKREDHLVSLFLNSRDDALAIPKIPTDTHNCDASCSE